VGLLVHRSQHPQKNDVVQSGLSRTDEKSAVLKKQISEVDDAWRKRGGHRLRASDRHENR
jgi:hypothetical protein